MTHARGLAVAIGALVGLAAAAAGAESVKLKPEASIYVDAAGDGLSRPEGVGCSAGRLAVADTGHGRIVLYDVLEDALRPTGAIVVPQIPLPLRVGLLAGGDLLALDGRSRRIGRLSPAGEFRGWLEPAETPWVPRTFAIGPADRVYVLDLSGRRVVVLAAGGAVERSIAFPPEAAFLSDLAVDGRGDVYAIDSVGRRAYAARAGQATLAALGPSLAEELDFPSAIAVDDEGHLFVLDEHGSGIVILGRDGSFHGRQSGMGWKEGLLRYPADACLDGRGSLFVAERGNNRVQRFLVR